MDLFLQKDQNFKERIVSLNIDQLRDELKMIQIEHH